MHVFMTGGAGDLGTVLTPRLSAAGDTPISFDIQAPRHPNAVDRRGSLLARAALPPALAGVEAVVHIAAWHGIHEVRGQKDAYDFWDLNVTGTFNILEAAVRAGINKFIFISSTSIEDNTGLYGHSKVLSEELVRAYERRHNLKALILRPRAFIPGWNRDAYDDYLGWARWFWPGAVHIDDVAAAVMLSLAHLENMDAPAPPLVVDGAYDFSPDDLGAWDKDGPGSTFARVFPEYVALAKEHELDTTICPRPKDMTETTRILGYRPGFSLRNLLVELARYGREGPPGPDLTPVSEDL